MDIDDESERFLGAKIKEAGSGDRKKNQSRRRVHSIMSGQMIRPLQMEKKAGAVLIPEEYFLSLVEQAWEDEEKGHVIGGHDALNISA